MQFVLVETSTPPALRVIENAIMLDTTGSLDGERAGAALQIVATNTLGMLAALRDVDGLASRAIAGASEPRLDVVARRDISAVIERAERTLRAVPMPGPAAPADPIAQRIVEV